MKYKQIYDMAIKIDNYIDEHFATGKKNLPDYKKLMALMENLYTGHIIGVVGRGAYKTCYQIKSQKKEIALKIGTQKYVDRDHEIIATARKVGLKRHTVKYFWKTKYCMIQRFYPEKPSSEEIAKLKLTFKSKGYTDIRRANVCIANGHAKAFDVSYK